MVSGCQRAWSGPLGALVVFAVVQGSRRGVGTLPTLITWKGYSAGDRAPSKKAVGGRGGRAGRAAHPPSPGVVPSAASGSGGCQGPRWPSLSLSSFVLFFLDGWRSG